MKYSNTNNSAHPRKQKTTISSTVVKCICITASCIVTACGLLGLGVTCFVIRLTDPFLGPCPLIVTIVVFGVAGLLFFFSFIFLIVLCKKRNNMKRKAELEDLPVCAVEVPKKTVDEEKCNEEKKENTESVNPEEAHSGDENFEMSQKSADVSLWIEQQKSEEATEEDYPLENTDGVANHESDDESSEAEMTAL